MSAEELTRMHLVTVCTRCGRTGTDLTAAYCAGADGCGAVLSEMFMTGAQLIQAGQAARGHLA